MKAEQTIWTRPMVVAIASHTVLLALWWFVFSFVSVHVGEILADGTVGWWPWPTKLHFAVFEVFTRINHVLTPAILAVACLLADVKILALVARTKGQAQAYTWASSVSLAVSVAIFFNVLALASPFIKAANMEIVHEESNIPLHGTRGDARP